MSANLNPSQILASGKTHIKKESRFFLFRLLAAYGDGMKSKALSALPRVNDRKNVTISAVKDRSSSVEPADLQRTSTKAAGLVSVLRLKSKAHRLTAKSVDAWPINLDKRSKVLFVCVVVCMTRVA